MFVALSWLALSACEIEHAAPHHRVRAASDWLAEQRVRGELSPEERTLLDTLEREVVTLRVRLEDNEGRPDPEIESALLLLEVQMARFEVEED